jgi:ELWxxDGT repeat protein
LVEDTFEGPNVGYPDQFAAVEATLYFTADNGIEGRELWKSDGTTAGTVLVKDINPNISYGYGNGSNPYVLTAIGGRLFFTADDGTVGRELWTSDGTAAGTILVKEIDPDTSPFGGPGGLAAVGGTLYFSADEGITGAERAGPQLNETEPTIEILEAVDLSDGQSGSSQTHDQDVRDIGKGLIDWLPSLKSRFDLFHFA